MSRRFGVDDVRAYARAGAERGLTEVAITEHMYRFPDVQDAFPGWWRDDGNTSLVANTLAEVANERLEQSLAEYVGIVSEASLVRDPATESAVLVGLEVDLVPGHMDEVADILAPFDWDILVGAVHWLGAWGFDNVDDPVQSAEWQRRDPDEAWLTYTAAMEEMAASGVCDVLAHLDKIKIAEVWPVNASAECEDRLVRAAASNGLAVEINTNGLRKAVGELYPGPDLLRALQAAGVGITFASDAHTSERVGDCTADIVSEARDAGFTHLKLFRGRVARTIPLPTAENASAATGGTG